MWIWLHLLEKPLMDDFIFCAVGRSETIDDHSRPHREFFSRFFIGIFTFSEVAKIATVRSFIKRKIKKLETTDLRAY